MRARMFHANSRPRHGVHLVCTTHLPLPTCTAGCDPPGGSLRAGFDRHAGGHPMRALGCGLLAYLTLSVVVMLLYTIHVGHLAAEQRCCLGTCPICGSHGAMS
jgi:hypothetical protein